MTKDIIAIGEILFDVYPGHKTLGGAPFNFIYHILNLTGRGSFISSVGDDETGRAVFEFFSANNIPSEFLQMDHSHPTGAAEVSLNEASIPEFSIKRDCAYDYITAGSEVLDYVRHKTAMVYYGTLAQRQAVSRFAIQSLWVSDTKKFYDVNIRENFYNHDILTSSLSAADIVKVNIDELKLISLMMLDEFPGTFNASRKLMEKFNIETLCVTMGESGSHLFRDNKHNFFRPEPRQVTDTVGAGDGFAAILALGCLLEWDLFKINSIATGFAGEICMIDGALPLNKSFYSKYLPLFGDL